MKTEIAIKKTYTLVLDEREAIWLKHLCQNKIRPDEGLEDERMREAFFNALKEEK